MKRVILLSGHSLFGIGIESLLLQEDDIKIVNWDKQLCDLVECTRKNKPDVIIINCDDPIQDFTPAILFALKEKFEMVIIGLSLSHNQATVFRGIQKQIINLEDLSADFS